MAHRLLSVLLVLQFAGCAPLQQVLNHPVPPPTFDPSPPLRPYQHVAGDIPLFRWDSAGGGWVAQEWAYGARLSTIPPGFRHPGVDEDGNALYRQVCVPPDVWLASVEARRRLPEVRDQVRQLEEWGQEEVARFNGSDAAHIGNLQIAVKQRDEARIVCVLLGASLAATAVAAGAIAGSKFAP